MPQPRILLVELDGLVAQNLRDAWSERAQVEAASAPKALDDLVSEPADLAIMNLDLSQGSGFGLVNRMRKMEALDGIQVMVVSDKETQAALDAHKQGPSPADGYVRGAEESAAAFTEAILTEAQRLVPSLPEPLPEAEPDDITEVIEEVREPDDADAALAATIEELGGYRVLRRLRDENGGAVFACMDEELGRPVAIKIMPPSEGADADDRMQRFLRERRVLALINSPYVLGVYGAGTHDGHPYLIRELIVGESLEARVKRDGPLEIATAVRYAREIALGLKHAFGAGVIHRRVCPRNIYVMDEHAKLARFGSSRSVQTEEHRITMVGARLPELTYVAPERVIGKDDHRSDIYSLGVTLFTLVAGKPPFTKARPINQLTGKRIERPAPLQLARTDAPATLARLVGRLIAEDQGRRPQSYDEIIAALDEIENALTSVPQPAPPPLPRREPTGVHGSLRRMNVLELVQTLELAKKTATVKLELPDELVGTLAFEDGRLIHAAHGLDRGEDAFFNLVPYRRGTFRVGYEPVEVETNIQTPTAGLLLEAVRRQDESGDARDPTGELFEPSDENLVPCASCGEPIDAGARKCMFCGAPTRPPRMVSSVVGYVVIALALGLSIYGGLQINLAPTVDHEDPSVFAPLIAQQRAKVSTLQTELTSARPKIEQMEAAAAADSARLAQQQKVTAETERNLSAALAADIGARLIRLRLSEDFTELQLELDDVALFGGQRDQLTEGGQNLLSRIAVAIGALKDVQVRVEGHTANTVPTTSSGHKNNWGLSGAQAMAVADHLRKQGLAKKRVSSAAMAEAMPIVSNRGPKGRARNRRVELHLRPDASLASSQP
jgi:serine/threonine protein kinase/flagellar motor protein MotB